jgi:uncharacterized protein DUF2064
MRAEFYPFRIGNQMHANAVLLFAGDSRRDETRKGLPPRFMMQLHARITATVRSFPDADLFVIRETGWLGGIVGRATSRAFDRGYQRVVLLAGDVAGLTCDHLKRAIAAGAAIGRSPDGGFYLLALSRRPDIDWNSIRWCTRHAFDDALAALGALHILPELDDIDSLPDALRVLRAPRFAALYACLLSLIRGPWFVVRAPHARALDFVLSMPPRAPPIPA